MCHGIAMIIYSRYNNNDMSKEQYNIGYEVTYRDRQHLVVDVFPDGEVILVPMDVINSECISVVDEDID
jgi:hypothetical protein